MVQEKNENKIQEFWLSDAMILTLLIKDSCVPLLCLASFLIDSHTVIKSQILAKKVLIILVLTPSTLEKESKCSKTTFYILRRGKKNS